MSDSGGKVALVTGAAAGIGRATALALARDGVAVVVSDVQEQEGVRTVDLIEQEGGRSIYIEADVSSEDAVESLVRSAVERFGRLDIAVNNAGVEQSGRPITDMTWDEAARIFEINVGGVLLGMKHEIPALQRCGGGAIINVSSIAGLIGFGGAGAYVASKHAVLGLTKTAALEQARHNIRVNAVCPGAIQTAMIDRFVQQDKQAKDGLINQHPLGRIGRPEEVASAIVWLCSDGAGFVTGEHLVVDGGYVVQ